MLFESGKGSYQDVWSKKTYDSREEAAIEQRKYIGTRAEKDQKRLERQNKLRSANYANYPHKSDGTIQSTRTVSHRIPKDLKPMEAIDVVTSKGNINRTFTDESARRAMRVDSSDHGMPNEHPMGAHKHIIEYDENGNYITDGKARPLNAEDRKENGDIL